MLVRWPRVGLYATAAAPAGSQKVRSRPGYSAVWAQIRKPVDLGLKFGLAANATATCRGALESYSEAHISVGQFMLLPLGVRYLNTFSRPPRTTVQVRQKCFVL